MSLVLPHLAPTFINQCLLIIITRTGVILNNHFYEYIFSKYIFCFILLNKAKNICHQVQPCLELLFCRYRYRYVTLCNIAFKFCHEKVLFLITKNVALSGLIRVYFYGFPNIFLHIYHEIFIFYFWLLKPIACHISPVQADDHTCLSYLPECAAYYNKRVSVQHTIIRE